MSPTGKRRFSVAGEIVDVPVQALSDAVVGPYPDLLRERQHHVDLWMWCQRSGADAPFETGANLFVVPAPHASKHARISVAIVSRTPRVSSFFNCAYSLTGCWPLSDAFVALPTNRSI